ncbi:MAG: hypothetical protein H6Q89_525 [Myxococcaceae bacterium]|nr:hypothetical protein [Myxococcaceae bacterium]
MPSSFLPRICLGALVLALSGCEGTASELGTKAAELPPPPPSPSGAPAISAFTCTPERGPASLTSACTFSVTHSQGKSVTCTLSVNDGRAPLLDAADCSSAVPPASFDTAGTFVITLIARDELGAVAQELKTITVSERPNLPPVIGSFVATPASGAVPLNTTFTWAVSDPESDALTCSIDVGNDGTVEYPLLDCATASRAHTLSTAGSAEVLFVVRDAKGLAAQSVIVLTARAPVGDVRIAKVEWGQSVVLESLRLVQGKSALLRVHVLGDKAGLQNVVVDAEGFAAGGASLGKLALVGPASPPAALVPADLKQQWTATVPAAWVEVGLEVRLKVDPLDVIAETDEVNNALVARPVVGKGNILQLTSVPVVHQGTTGAVVDIQPIMTAMWPVKSIANTIRAPYTFNGTLAGGDTSAWGNLLQNIAGVRQSDGSNRNYYGWVKVGYGSGIAGIGYVGQEAATGRDDSDDTAAHELGHNLGRNHAPCGGVAGADPSYPYAGGKIGSWGYNAVNKMLLNPATYADLMSYCNPAWVSDYSYKAVQTRLETQAFIPGGGPAMYAPVVLVAGTIRNGSEVSLRPVHRMIDAPSTRLDGAWAVRLVTLDGQQKVYPFTPDEIADADDRELHFTLNLPDPGPLAAVEVLLGSKTLQRALNLGADALAPAPSLRLAGPDAVRLTWDPQQFHSAEIAHLADDGERTTLGLWLTGGDMRIATDGLTGGRFEISLSDGVGSSRQVVFSER